MDRVAVLVDAGYLFAQGSTLLSGSLQPRKYVKLDEKIVVPELIQLAKTITGVDILRVYWYDGATKGMSTEQATLAHMDHVKLRLGFVNSVGQQKGVDSLIVTDLIDLARNRAICDAVLMSGDEDVRVGVQVAQSLGVRVHLLGIEPSRGSQSLQLLQEADSTQALDRASVAKFLKVLPIPAPAAAPAPAMAATTATAAAAIDVDATLHRVANDLIGPLDFDDVTKLAAVLATTSRIPPEYDGKLLARSGAAIGRKLTGDERRKVRGMFVLLAKAREKTGK